MNRLPVILNPHAGRGAEREADALRTAFEAVGTRVDIHVVQGEQVKDVVRGICDAGSPYIGVAGGDGTLSSAAGVLCGGGTAMLPIPLGTFNHFARRYGVPTVEAAVHAWEKRSVHAVPVGFLNDTAFLNNASCGFYPHIVRQRDKFEQILPHKAATWLAGWFVMARLPLMLIELEVRGDRHRFKTPALWVGLGPGSLRLPEPGDAHRDGHMLEIITPTAQGRLAIIALMLRTMIKLKRGQETPHDPALEVFHADRFTLQSPHRIDVGMDGEAHRLRPPLHFRYERDGLKVVSLIAP